jgi:hypothetical protein
MNVTKSAVSSTIICLKTRENILLKMEKLILIWICDWQAKEDNEKSTLIRSKVKMIFDNLKASIYLHLFAKKSLFIQG